MAEKLKIAFVSNFYNHGKIYDQWGTGFSILLSQLNCIKNIDVICPVADGKDMPVFPQKINIIEAYNLDYKLSILQILKILKNNKYDLIIFNYGPTVYGRSNIMNLIGLFIPIKVSKFNANTVLISQGSSLTNDAKNLGYKGLFDKLKFILMTHLEKHLYRHVKSFAQLPLYERLLREKVTKNKVLGVLQSDYIDAISTVYLNKFLESEYITPNNKNDVPVILLHGYWGPQKNIDFALRTLRNVKNRKYNYNLIISGGINIHFNGYKNHFEAILKEYKDIIYKYLGYVPEQDLFQLFINSDLILMPYNVPGGQSGVLEMSSFFNSNVICIDFPEFREEVKQGDNIILTNKENFEDQIIKFLENYNMNESVKDIYIKNKIIIAENNIKNFIERSTKHECQ